MISTLPKTKIQALLGTIQKKKELQQLDPHIVEQELQHYLKQEPKVQAELEQNFHERAAVYKKTVKEIRSRVRRMYGLFQHHDLQNKRRELVKKLFHASPATAKAIIPEILETHPSTKERLPFYSELYRKIFAVTGIPSSILDLGCGINPFSLPFMKLEQVTYHAYDIGREDFRALNKYFYWVGQHNSQFYGKAEILDIARRDVSTLPKSDLCFLFKMTDIIDQGKGHKATENILKAVPSRFIVLSFPTITMSGKPMNFPRRKWVELLCRRLGFFYAVVTFHTELFYIIRKEQQ